MRQVWTYKARDRWGKPVSGTVESESREQAIEHISRQRLVATAVKPRPERVGLATIAGNFGSANREKLIIFTRNLMTLQRSGIPLLRALTIIGRGAKDLGMTEEIEGIKNDLHAGHPLSEALRRFPRKFPPIYVASIAAGESSGALDDVLEQLADMVEKEMVMARQVKAALRYPAMVIGAIALAVFVLMTFVIPRFAGIYGKFGAELPLATRIVIDLSNIFASYWYVMIALAASSLFILKKTLSTEKGRMKWDRMMLKLPILGDLIIKANVARFATMLRTLFRSGVPMVACLNIMKETASNKAIAREIGKLSESFELGREIGPSPDDYPFFPNMALEMFQVGLESGSVESIMAELAAHYEMELEYKSRHLTAILEPILTVAIGAMVLVLALSIFLPMWNLIKIFR